MAKQLTKTWEEATNMVSDCKIVVEPVLKNNGTELVFLLEDPLGQRFFFQVSAASKIGLNGNALVLVQSMNIVALEPENGDIFRDVRF